MSRTSLDYLFRVETPWIRAGLGEEDRRQWYPSHYYSRPSRNDCVRLLRGDKMRSVDAMMLECSAALQFGHGFGGGWDQFADCLVELDEWLPGDAYIIVVEHGDQVLEDAGLDELALLLSVLDGAGKSWSKPFQSTDEFRRDAIPFHVLFLLSDDTPGLDGRILEAARVAEVAVGSVQGG